MSLSGVPCSIRSRRRGAFNPAGLPPARSTRGSQPDARESYLLLGAEPAVDEARTFLASLGEAHAPALWEASPMCSGWPRHKILGKRMPLATLDEALLETFPNIAARLGVLTT